MQHPGKPAGMLFVACGLIAAMPMTRRPTVAA
jgi:hypothetical protein